MDTSRPGAARGQLCSAAQHALSQSSAAHAGAPRACGAVHVAPDGARHLTPGPVLADTTVTADVLKFFGCELGAQTNFDKTTVVSIVNGAHDAKKLSELLEGFIKRFVQCYSCGNPETTIKIKKELLHLK